MTEKNERRYGGCQEPSIHTEHMCVLMEKGLTEEIRRRSLHPAYVCGNCGAQADRAEDLCNPEEIKP